MQAGVAEGDPRPTAGINGTILLICLPQASKPEEVRDAVRWCWLPVLSPLGGQSLPRLLVVATCAFAEKSLLSPCSFHFFHLPSIFFPHCPAWSQSSLTWSGPQAPPSFAPGPGAPTPALHLLLPLLWNPCPRGLCALAQPWQSKCWASAKSCVRDRTVPSWTAQAGPRPCSPQKQGRP